MIAWWTDHLLLFQKSLHHFRRWVPACGLIMDQSVFRQLQIFLFLLELSEDHWWPAESRHCLSQPRQCSRHSISRPLLMVRCRLCPKQGDPCEVLLKCFLVCWYIISGDTSHIWHVQFPCFMYYLLQCLPQAVPCALSSAQHSWNSPYMYISSGNIFVFLACPC